MHMDKVREYLSRIGRKGGAAKGERKSRGDADYYRNLRAMRPSVAAVKRLLASGGQGSWSGFKHRLMEELGVPSNEFHRWDVPQAWIDAYKKAHGR